MLLSSIFTGCPHRLSASGQLESLLHGGVDCWHSLSSELSS